MGVHISVIKNFNSDYSIKTRTSSVDSSAPLPSADNKSRTEVESSRVMKPLTVDTAISNSAIIVQIPNSDN